MNLRRRTCDRGTVPCFVWNEPLASLLGKVSDAVTAVAAVQELHGEMLSKIFEIRAHQGARLNAIDGRLAIIEPHTGLVKA